MINHHLQTLASSGLIQLARERPELEYLFRHALVQESAYRSLLRADRRQLHRAIGKTIRTHFGQQVDEVAATIAYHFEKSEDWPDAFHWLMRAAEIAFEQYALLEARGLLERALACADHFPPDLDTEVRLRLMLSTCIIRIGGDLAKAEAHLQHCLELTADPTTQAQVYFQWGQMLHIFMNTQYETAEKYYTEALKRLPNKEPAQLYGSTLANLGYLYRYWDQTDRAVAVLEEALAFAQAQASHRLLAETLTFLSGAYLDQRRYDEALTVAEQALVSAQVVHHLELIGRCHSFLQEIHTRRAKVGHGSPEAILPHIQEMQRFGREYNIAISAAFAADGMAQYAELVGDSALRLQSVREAAQVFRAAKLPQRAAYRQAFYGRLLLEAEQIETAEQAFAQVRTDLAAEPVFAELLIARAYAEAKQLVQAQAHVERAFALTRSPEGKQQWQEQIETADIWQPLRELIN